MPASRPVVAIVDDDPDMLKSLSRLLKASGFAAETFDSAEAFLDRPATGVADCLLLDIHLGGMSGIELRRRLAAAGSKLSVIFMTANDDEAVQREAVDSGCIALLSKPFSARSLRDALGKVTDLRRAP